MNRARKVKTILGVLLWIASIVVAFFNIDVAIYLVLLTMVYQQDLK